MPKETKQASSLNFAFLAEHEATLVLLAAQAEKLFAHDAVASLVKLRLLGELDAQETAARSSISCAAARSRTSSPQRKWLERIAAQLKVEVVVDKAALDSGQFAQHGRLNRLNKVFDGKLELILGDLAEDVWEGV
ncbi:MAG: hypothetical protein K8H88_22390 [Sandaracinaceae bacterium]|nr:hypothetical protein [Sandaracinaceae bacterium]